MAQSTKIRKRVTGLLVVIAFLAMLPFIISNVIAQQPVEKPEVTYADPLMKYTFPQSAIFPQGMDRPLLYDSPSPVISPDGSRILFIANPGWKIEGQAAKGNGIFVYHRDTGKVEDLHLPGRSQGRFGIWHSPTLMNRVSWDGRVTAARANPEAVISPDGRIEASFTEALVTAGNPPTSAWKSYLDLLDRVSGKQERVEVPGAHGQIMSDARPLSDLQFSQDGRYLAFQGQFSKGWHDPQGGFAGNYWWEVMVYDRSTKQLAFANVNEKGKRVSVPCTLLGMSADGHYVLFQAGIQGGDISSEPPEITAWKRQQRLSTEDTETNRGLYLYDTHAKKIHRFSQVADAVAAARTWFYPFTSSDARFVITDTMLHDTSTGTTLDVSEGGRRLSEQLGLPYYTSQDPSISADGRYISYVTRMSNIKFDGSSNTPDDPKWKGVAHLAVAIQVYDRETQKTVPVVVASDLPLEQLHPTAKL